MKEITDEYMRARLALAREYCVCLIHATPKRKEPGADQIVWEHGRRNFSLQDDGRLAIVCPVTDGKGLSGLYIFNVGADEVKTIMEADPAVRAGIFTYEVHPCRGFPGDALPA